MNYLKKTFLTLLGTMTLAVASASASPGAEAAAAAAVTGIEGVGVPTATAAPAPRTKKNKNAQNAGTDGLEPDLMPLVANADRMMESTDVLKLSSKRKGNRRLIGVKGKEGIDISHYQHTIDWDEVATDENVSYVYIKCSEGNNFKDDCYIRNAEGAHRVGVPMGVYHFYRPDVKPADQLRNMSEIAKREDFDLVPMIDVEKRGEVSQERFVADLKEFARLVGEYYDCKPLMYSGQNFYNKYLANEFKEYHWMMAKYSDEEPIIHDGLNYTFWQYSSKGRIKGIKGNVDRSCLMEGFSLSDVEY